MKLKMYKTKIMNRKTHFLIISLSTLVLNTYSQAPVDGFNKGKGNATVAGAFSSEDFTKYYAADGIRNIERKTITYSFFSVVGVTDNFDVQLNVPYVISGPEKSFQDISVYLKYTFLKIGKSKLLGSFGQSSPLNKYKTEDFYAVGQQASCLDTRLIFQHDLGKGLFAMVQSGYIKRTDPTPSSLPFSAKIGYASNKIYADVWFDYQHAYGGSDFKDGKRLPFTTLGVGYSKIGGQVYKSFNKYLGSLNNHLGVSISSNYVLNGRNVGKAIVFSGAIIYNI